MKTYFFTQPTCGPCRMVKPMVDRESTERGYSVQYIDSEAHGMELFTKYNVLSTPTFLTVDSDGNELKRHSGSMTKPMFIDFMENNAQV